MKKLVGLLFILFISISFTTKVKALNVSENDITLSKGSNTTLSITDNFDKEISLDEAISLIKKNSRHYAKRQYTFFNNQMNIKWFNTNYEDFSLTVEEVYNYIKGE